MMVLILVRCMVTNISSPIAIRLSLIISNVKGSIAARRDGFLDRFGMSHLLDVQKTVLVHGERLAWEDHRDGGWFLHDGWSFEPLPSREQRALVNGAGLEAEFVEVDLPLAFQRLPHGPWPGEFRYGRLLHNAPGRSHGN